MLNLLALEWKKFKSNSVVTLLGFLFLILFPVGIFSLKEFMPEEVPFPILPTRRIVFEFPAIWDYLGYEGNWMIFFFIGFIGVHMVTSEVSNKTLRQNILTGMTRKEYFLGKVYSITAISLACTVLYVLMAMLIGWFHTEDVTFSQAMDCDYAPLKYFLMCMGYLSFGLFLGFVIRKGGIATFFYLSYILFLELLVRALLYFHVFNKIDWLNKFDFIVNYLPMNVIEDLMPMPVYKILDELPDKFRDDIPIVGEVLTTTQSIVGSTFYIILFLGLAYRSFSRRDI